MPDTDPIISDDDAATLFVIEDEIRLHERSLEAANADRKGAKEMLADALKRRAKFTRGLKEKHPLFDMGGAGAEVDAESSGEPSSVTFTASDFPKIEKLGKALRAKTS